MPDKVVASQSIGTSVLAILILIAVMRDQMIFIDIALTYAMLLFIVVIAVARYLETGCILK
ncbi:MAG: monovalent cation/H+ antiporter complex subunit F [Methanosarcinaceae archaeon]|jgi:multicomponent Na+:H+ antiporter subunit F|nr:monovalent cation/H+ antiporter complex subunit F [Methanosarcinaceae archaeon]NKQ39501.1 hypothetical protein [Methanosarcinales archaeon]